MSAADTATADAMNRLEKKAWKALQKFNLEPVDDIIKVEIRRTKGQTPVVVDAPKVYKVPGPTPSYVILGPLRLNNVQQELARTYRMLAEKQAQNQARAAAQQAEPAAAAPSLPAEGANGDAEINTAGLDEGDIMMAVEQTGRSKKTVVEALRAHNGDLVETIMALTG